ncbi:hypothetical protein M569_05154, partial [Genlisea aurea]
DLIEIRAPDPALHVLFIPGNPGVVSFYTDFLVCLYELLGGTASVTGIGHTSHFEKNWGHGHLFSLQEQVDHKARFMEQEFKNVEVPIVLVGHSIGSYMCIELFKRRRDKVRYCICLHPFLAVNRASLTQASIAKLVRSPVLCATASFVGAILGMLPYSLSRFITRNSVGKSWSPFAIQILLSHVLKYHTLRNMLFLAKTEFETLSEKPEVDFIREKKNEMAFIFGLDDHWAPRNLSEELRKEVPDLRTLMEEGGYPHAFGCTEDGSLAIAKLVSGLIENRFDE